MLHLHFFGFVSGLQVTIETGLRVDGILAMTRDNEDEIRGGSVRMCMAIISLECLAAIRLIAGHLYLAAS